jgi:hypothetical protein
MHAMTRSATEATGGVPEGTSRIADRARRRQRRSLQERAVREGAADKAAIQLVRVQPCQLLMSDT